MRFDTRGPVDFHADERSRNASDGENTGRSDQRVSACRADSGARMKSIPSIGARVVCPSRYRGVGVVEAIRILRYEARVRWPERLVSWVPLEELSGAVEGEGAAVAAEQTR